MRFLQKDWSKLESTIERIRFALQLREKHRCFKLSLAEFADVAALNCFANPGHHDKQGRPILYVLLRNFNLKKVSEEHFLRYFCYIVDRMCEKMPVNIDQMVLVIDGQDFGYSQMFTNHIKAMLRFN